MSSRGVGNVIFSLHLGVGHSVLLQLEGVGRVFSNHHISKCSGPITRCKERPTAGKFRCWAEERLNSSITRDELLYVYKALARVGVCVRVYFFGGGKEGA